MEVFNVDRRGFIFLFEIAPISVPEIHENIETMKVGGEQSNTNRKYSIAAMIMHRLCIRGAKTSNPEIEYPKSVWTYLNQVPADGGPDTKKRIEQMIDRWIADSNMPAFSDKNSKKQLDVLTASVAQKKALTIATLTARTVMLDQLIAEVNKMKRMLLELNMVAIGDKRFIANSPQPSSM